MMEKYSSQDLNCLVCNKLGVDLHHIKTRKSGGSDNDYNLMPLCRLHHTEIHKIGLTTFANKYNQVKEFLISHGWELDFRNRYVRYLTQDD